MENTKTSKKKWAICQKQKRGCFLLTFWHTAPEEKFCYFLEPAEEGGWGTRMGVGEGWGTTPMGFWGFPYSPGPGGDGHPLLNSGAVFSLKFSYLSAFPKKNFLPLRAETHAQARNPPWGLVLGPPNHSPWGASGFLKKKLHNHPPLQKTSQWLLEHPLGANQLERGFGWKTAPWQSRLPFWSPGPPGLPRTVSSWTGWERSDPRFSAFCRTLGSHPKGGPKGVIGRHSGLDRLEVLPVEATPVLW